MAGLSDCSEVSFQSDDLIWWWPSFTGSSCLNTLRPRQNGPHFADYIFKCIILNENVWISIKISLKFAPKGPINNIPSLATSQATSHYLNQWWLDCWRIYASLGLNELTHWGWDEMDNISQMTFSNVFSSVKMFELWWKFHWSLFLRVQSSVFQHWFRWWLGAVQVTSHYLDQWWLVYRRIYASLGLSELIAGQLLWKRHLGCFRHSRHVTFSWWLIGFELMQATFGLRSCPVWIVNGKTL